MVKKWDKDCITCQIIRGTKRISDFPRIIETNYWMAEHASYTYLKGWVILVIKRHCTALHELTEAEMVELGKLVRMVCRALHAIMKTEKEYLIQFSEGVGFAHLHIHIIARMPDWPEDLRGPRVMKAMAQGIEGQLTTEQVTPLILGIRDYLLKNLPKELIVK